MISYDALVSLERIRGQYSNKRTVTYRLLHEVTDLAQQAIAEAEAKAEARADGRIAEVERWHESTQRALDALRSRNKQLEDVLAEKRRLNEEREQSGEEVQVKIGRSLGGSWLVADLEEIAYRLRCGGATDDTPVKVTDYTATANVVAPELVPLSRPSDRPPAVVDDWPAAPVQQQFVVRRLAVLMGAAFVLGIVFVGLVGVVIR